MTSTADAFNGVPDQAQSALGVDRSTLASYPSRSPPNAALAWAVWFDGLHSATWRDPSRQWIVRAKHFADARFDQAVSLDSMAAEANLSKYHFLRAFRQILQKTPRRYVTHRRIARARELLERTNWPVTAICFEVGFQSLGSFISRFKEIVGEPPGRYRRRFGKGSTIDGRAMPACLYSALDDEPARRAKTAILEKFD